ncbi:UMP kinase [Parasporobacterium paucivorans]|uniref:Uridylate kinase n=1 Tax=Parasporobacterium paucivorans DSM 15970 TaxID=1122934 RepID=A0A1M6AGS2_9FIRM|nr:UMP kinase [Parasporobacterium paucivorans]SHI35627.1 uridylate kinase [Parasporobacterium paucivorans DSM 15970]
MSEYNRVLLKLSGEALAGEKSAGFDEDVVVDIARQVKQLVSENLSVAIVIGGGNFWRGRTSNKIDRTKADTIGMLATVMNCIYVSEIFRTEGMETSVFTPFECGSFTRLFSKDSVNQCFAKNAVVFFAGGTGHPYFSTDTAMALRAVEIEADCILAAKSIDGVYDSDPDKNPDAVKIEEMKMQDIIDNKLGVIDTAAAVLCVENKMPMLIFGLNGKNSIINAASGKFSGTKISV